MMVSRAARMFASNQRQDRTRQQAHRIDIRLVVQRAEEQQLRRIGVGHMSRGRMFVERRQSDDVGSASAVEPAVGVFADHQSPESQRQGLIVGIKLRQFQPVQRLRRIPSIGRQRSREQHRLDVGKIDDDAPESDGARQLGDERTFRPDDIVGMRVIQLLEDARDAGRIPT